MLLGIEDYDNFIEPEVEDYIKFIEDEEQEQTGFLTKRRVDEHCDEVGELLKL